MLIKNKTLSGSYSIEVTGYDWGPSVNKAILTFEKEISEVTKDLFKVEEVKECNEGVQGFPRTVTNVYLSDAKGNKVKEASKNVTLELKVSPKEGNAFIFSSKVDKNCWTNPYLLRISLAEGKILKSGEEEVTAVTINEKFVTKFLPTVDRFKEGIYSKDGDISMKYAYYEPDDDKKSPLIIWLHGVGEGGRDTTITTLGNRVGALIEDKIQNKFGGAYVLVPQSPTMWMDCTGNAEYTNDGKAIYTKSLFNLIKYYVDSNERIDRNKIYIGGCSNGGYMTIKMLFQDPEYFAAAYPICEAYNDSWISDEEITSIKNVPIWFTYAKNDRGVDPNENSKATIDRLIKAGNVNLHKSVFDSVVDTSGLYKDEVGNPYEYPGHFSWIYVFNDECKEGKESLWSWLAKQSKA